VANGANDHGQTQRLGVLSQKSCPEEAAKTIPLTDAIFHHLSQGNHDADAASDVLRLSVDAKATVKVGPFSRGGKSRVKTVASDHDFTPEATLTPVGIWVPTLDEMLLSGVCSTVTSDCLADCLTQWWESVRERFGHVSTLAIQLDNGPENHRRRTQCMQRLGDFVHHYHLHVR
jgi:Rhodopirellula transposase DDE domain